MKKGKFLVVAALLSCCTVLAACGGTSSSGETSSTTTSEPDSSEDSTSGYSSEDSSSSGSDETSSDSSSSDDSSSDDSSTGGEEPASTSTITLDLANNIYAYVYLATGSEPSLDDEVILGANYNYSQLTAEVETGSYIYIENLNSAADYVVTFEDGSSVSGTLEAYGEEVSDLIQITGNASIVMTEATSTGGEDTGNKSTITMTYENNIYAYVYSSADDVLDDDDEVILAVNYGMNTTEATVDTGTYIFIENLNAKADYTVTFEDDTTATGTIDEYGGVSEAIEITGNATLALTAASTSGGEDTGNHSTLSLSVGQNVYASVYSSEDTTLDEDDDVVLMVGWNSSILEATVDTGTYIFIENLNAKADYTVTFEDDTTATGTIDEYGGVSEAIEITGNAAITMSQYVPETAEIAEVNNWSSQYISDVSLEVGESYEVGAEVDYSFVSSYYTPADSALTYAANYYITVNGTTVSPTAANYDSATGHTTYRGTFTMPEADATVDILLASTTTSDTNGFTASFQSDDNVQCLSIANPSASYSANSSFYLVMKKAAGVSITGIEYSTDGGENWTPSSGASVYTMNGNYNSDIVYKSIYSFTYFSAGQNVLFKADYTTDNAYYSLTLTNESDITISSGSFSYHPLAGDAVYLSYSAKAGKYVSAAATVVTDSGDTVTTSSNSTSYLRFTMPEANVSITFILGDQVAVTTAENDGLSKQIVVKSSLYSSDTVEYVTPGSTYYICAYAADGYILSGFDINGTEYTSTLSYTGSSYGGPWTYVQYQVPSDATSVSVSAILTQAYIASSSIDSSKATVYFGSASTGTYAEGASVSFTITPNAYYSLDTSSITVTDANNNDIAVSNIQTNSYSGSVTGTFTMPAANVVLSATLTEKNTVAVSLSMNEFASTAISSVSIYGGSSRQYLYNTTEGSVSFIEGETLSISVSYTSASYESTIYAVTGETMTEITPSYTYSTSISASYTVTSDLTGFYIEASEKSHLNVTYNVDSSLSVTYAWSTSSYASTESSLNIVDNYDDVLYSGYYCYLKVTGAADGYSPVVTVTGSDGSTISVTTTYVNDSSYSSSTQWYRFSPSMDFTLNISVQAQCKITINNEENLYCTVEDSDYTEYSSGSYVDAGTRMSLWNYSSSTVYYTIDYAEESTQDLSGTLDGYYSYYYFYVTSDVTVTFSSTDPNASTGEGEEASTSAVTISNSTGVTLYIKDSSNYSELITADGDYTGTIATGSTIYIQNGSFSSAISLTYTVGESEATTVTLDEYDVTDDITVTGDLSITVSLASVTE